MNKKLTPEQRDIYEWVEDALEHNDSFPLSEFKIFLTANTAEDECEVTIINPTRLVVFGADGFDTAEDEGNYIVWSDGRKTQIEDEELLQYIAENIQQEDK